MSDERDDQVEPDEDRYPDKRREAQKPKAPAPKIEAGIPKPPRHLDRAAKRFFVQYAKQLHEQGVTKLIDRALLAIFAQALSDEERLTIEIRTEGEIKKGPNGGDVWNPKIGLLKAAQKRIMECGDRLGLNPRYRSAIKFPEGELPDGGGDDDDPEQLKFSELMRQARERQFVRGESWNRPDDAASA